MSWPKIPSQAAFCLIIGLLACLGTIVGLRFVSPQQPEPTPFVIREIPEGVVDISFRHAKRYPVDPGARLLLIPHHLVAGREIASLLTSVPTKKRILLLSPDHFSIGKQALSITDKSFTWNEQAIRPDLSLNKQLLATHPQALRLQDSVFEREHGVRGLVPFLNQAWPQATVNAMTVRNDASTSTLNTLSDQLDKLLDTDPELIIAVTIDFSHELPAYLADLHDTHAIGHLEARNAEAFRQVEIDSPPLFFLLSKLAEQQNVRLTVQAQTNSLRLMYASTTELGTSHALMSSEPGLATTNSQRFVFFHDPTRAIQSSEDRAYRGYDEVREARIPFETVFVKETQTDRTIWHTFPLRRADNKTWELVSDQQFAALTNNRRTWEAWAAENLSKGVSE